MSKKHAKTVESSRGPISDLLQTLSIAAEAAAYNNFGNHITKYARNPLGNLEAFIQLDLEIYRNIKRLLRPGVPEHDNGQARSLILRYLQDFNDTAYNAILSKTNGTNPEAVKKLSSNPLALYQAFWRFENYIKKLLGHSAEELEAELRGESRSLWAYQQ